ncbi:hypothetical protein HK405_009716, partial [Cladochytrium tenue]
MSPPQPRSLLRALARAQKQWPAQPGREQRLSVAIHDRIRALASTPGASTADGLAEGERELASLRRMLAGDVGKQ